MLVAGGFFALVGGVPPAGAYPSADVSFAGHGWGHGIGMGQWGALGYAIGQDNGLGPQTYQWIVNHYYAPATLQPYGPDAGDATTVRVALTENNGLNPIVAGNGANVNVPGTATSAPAVLMTPGNPGTWNISMGPTCGGPWTPASSNVPSAQTTTANVSGGTVSVCMVAGNKTVHGAIQGAFNASAAVRTVNVVNIGQYLADVVPSESSGGWGQLGPASPPPPQGEPWGFQELEAQAVAARSYVLSTPGGYGGYADTCDQTCQSYPGTQNEDPLATLAVSDTAGQVLEFAGGQVATTEYSASTGGYTTGGPFTIVPDDGDAVCIAGACNPNHTWHAQVPVTTIQSLWPSIGTLQSVNVTGRNGYGDYGGRVTSVRLVGSAGSVDLTGPEFSDNVGLNSDWFEVSSQPSGGVGGYWLSAADGAIFSFGNAAFYGSMGGHPLNEPVVGMAPTPDHRGYWEVASDGGLFSFGDAGFAGSMGGRPLNQPIVGMAPDAATGGYWEVASDGGIFAFNAPFFGSMGGRPLNQPIVGMAATPDGGGYWMVASDGGIFSFGDAAFYGSTGALRLVRPVVGMAPTPDGAGYSMVASDGGIFTFGDAHFEGSAAGTAAGAGAAAMVPTHTGLGYLIVTSGGLATNFGDAPQFGDLTTALSSYGGRVVAAAPTPG
ncbi:MAG TPA: SpoIID/LytB domain-containing protein [Acidimicrobiales bacterium]|nr:SpoIID/LytB domain-containing protein [Acidimicrobiales bacterium]